MDVKRGFLTTKLVVVPPLVPRICLDFRIDVQRGKHHLFGDLRVVYFLCLVLSLVLQLFWAPPRRDEYTTEPMVQAAKARIAEKRK